MKFVGEGMSEGAVREGIAALICFMTARLAAHSTIMMMWKIKVSAARIMQISSAVVTEPPSGCRWFSVFEVGRAVVGVVSVGGGVVLSGGVVALQTRSDWTQVLSGLNVSVE